MCISFSKKEEEKKEEKKAAPATTTKKGKDIVIRMRKILSTMLPDLHISAWKNFLLFFFLHFFSFFHFFFYFSGFSDEKRERKFICIPFPTSHDKIMKLPLPCRLSDTHPTMRERKNFFFYALTPFFFPHRSFHGKFHLRLLCAGYRQQEEMKEKKLICVIYGNKREWERARRKEEKKKYFYYEFLRCETILNRN